ncbi:MAG: PAS domain-containing sensor histidine kinase [Marinilabiliaceae bacterium]|nr:PAS domain-containing sensor histidine kinase [Marinilabiliaceae bacterium]
MQGQSTDKGTTDPFGYHPKATHVDALSRIYQKAWHSKTFAMLLVDAEGVILNLSAYAEELFRQPAIHLMGYPMTDLIIPGEKSEFDDCLFQARTRKEEFTTRYFHLRAPSEKTVYFTFEFISDDDDNAQYLLLMRDVTDQEVYSNNLRNKELYLNMAQKIANLGHYLLDIPSGYWTCSPELDVIFGIDGDYAKTIEGWLEIIHPDDREMMGGYFLNEVVGHCQPFNKEYRIVRIKDGVTRWIHGKGELRMNKHNEPVQMIGTIQDITERKQHEAELRASRALYHDLVETSQDLVWQCDARGHFVFLNQAWERLLGYRQEEMLGRHFTDFQSASRTEAGHETLRRILSEGNIRGHESCYLNRQGDPVYLVFNAKRVDDEHGNVTGIRGTAYDYTESRRNQQLLKEKSDELDRFFNTALDLLCVCRIDGTFMRVNPEWTNVLGYEMDEIVGQNFLNMVHPEDLEGTLGALRLLKQNESVFNFVNRYRTKSGAYKYIEWRSTLVGDLIYAAARDISERIEIEETQRLVNKELEDSNAQKDKFLYIIAHDLRNPLSNILGFTDLLANNYASYTVEEAGRLLNMLNDSTHALYELIENLLNWALSKTGRIVFQPSQISLWRIANSVVGQLHSLAKSKDIHLLNKVPSLAEAWGDNAMMTTIIRNLVSNAIKFSHPGAVIAINYHEQPGLAILEVKDQGVGISPEVIPILFWAEEVYSTHGTMGERGTGLGLPLCKELMEKQNGHIWVESELGQGSSFFVSLPLVP